MFEQAATNSVPAWLYSLTVIIAVICVAFAAKAVIELVQDRRWNVLKFLGYSCAVLSVLLTVGLWNI